LLKLLNNLYSPSKLVICNQEEDQN